MASTLSNLPWFWLSLYFLIWTVSLWWILYISPQQVSPPHFSKKQRVEIVVASGLQGFVIAQANKTLETAGFNPFLSFFLVLILIGFPAVIAAAYLKKVTHHR